MGEGTVGERHVAGGRVPLEDLREDEMPWYSFREDVNGGWLKTDKVNEAKKV